MVQGLGVKELTDTVRDAARLVFFRLFNYYSTGHAWQVSTGTVLKSQRLYLARWLENKADLPTDRGVTNSDFAMGSLFRRALHSVCVRAGKLSGLGLEDFTIQQPMEALCILGSGIKITGCEAGGFSAIPRVLWCELQLAS